MTISQSDFYIKRGDRLPVLARTLTWQDGTVIDLTGCTVEWKMVDEKTRAVKVDASATVVDAAAGKVEYRWGSSDTDTTGHYIGEWRVVYPDTKHLTVPTLNFVNVHVRDSLA